MNELTAKSVLQVLIVEDEVDAAETLAELIRLEGHVVRIASTASSALAAARLKCPDIAFVDIGLPDGTGWDVAAELKELPGAITPFLVAITGRDDDNALRRSYWAGIHLHLTKPVEAKEIRSLLDRFLSVIS